MGWDGKSPCWHCGTALKGLPKSELDQHMGAPAQGAFKRTGAMDWPHMAA